jgi:metal transporter CNNM
MDHLKSIPGSSEDEESAIDYAALLIWGDKPRIITGAEVLGRLLKGITAVSPA